MFKKFTEWYKAHERHVTTGAILLGFVVDNFTLQRIDLLFENFVLLTYLFIAGLGIILVHGYDAGALHARIFQRTRLWAPLFIQYAFGALFSGFIIFYMRSATLSGSALFVVLLLVLLVGNEVFKKQAARLTFQVSIFFVALFSYFIFSVPVLVNSIGLWVFVLSGLVAVAVIAGFIKILARIMPARLEKEKKIIWTSIGAIFVAMNIFYMTNIIPPVPLSLKEAGVYHFVERTPAGNYLTQREKRGLVDTLRLYRPMNIVPGEAVYVFSSVFAPTDLSVPIFHSWQYFDAQTEEWIRTDRLRFSIVGGRDGGYRGYSAKTQVFPGRWRVDVVTEREQLLGRVLFEVRSASEVPDLETEIQ